MTPLRCDGLTIINYGPHLGVSNLIVEIGCRDTDSFGMRLSLLAARCFRRLVAQWFMIVEVLWELGNHVDSFAFAL